MNIDSKRYLILVETIILFETIFLINTVFAQAPNWTWVRNTGGILDEQLGGMVVDQQGNVYVTGFFNSAQINIGSYYLTNSDSTGNTSDVYVSKYDSNGNVLWAKRIGKTGNEESHAITIDTYGNVYIGGCFAADSLYFGLDTLINAGNGTEDIFFLKYDSTGNELWASRAGSIWYDRIYSATTDQYGNIYFAGVFNGANITFGSYTLANSVLYKFKMFVVKYDSIGNTIWAKTVVSNSSVSANSISIDSFENIYIGGDFTGELIISTDTMFTTGGSDADVFIAKYDSNGNALWGRRAGGNQYDQGLSIVADSLGNACIVGYFHISIVFGSDTLIENGVYNMFISKYDPNGNVLWARSALGNNNAVSANAVTIDTASDYYIGGNFYMPSVVFGNDTLINYDSIHHNNAFLAKYNSNGTEIWAKSNGGSDNDELFFLSIDLSGNLYAAGIMASPNIVFDTITVTNTYPYSRDIFVGKIQTQSIVTNIVNHKMLPNIRLYPNPFNYSTTLQFDFQTKNLQLNIYNIYGQQIKQIKNISEQTFTMYRDNLPSGLYFISVIQDNKIIETNKLIIID